MVAEEAVQVRSACKHYGASDGPKRKDVLINLDMTVSRGTIYGLLGASGCGKTTLLSCIVGRRHLDSGEIWVLGGKPSTPGSGVPGPRIGYMPQDTALIAEFTVKEAVYYFGQIFGMSEVRLSERFKFLSNLLDLPPDNRYVKNCSGGQQRRVSFAAALVHEPELLILDEPTVGLDPVLRDRIWNHLVEISTKDKVAIIITTHYIEETRQAQTIGLMRSGTLLAEENPDYLLTLFRTETLEEVFLYLSEKQSKNQPVLEFQSDEYLAHKQLRNNLYDSMTNVNTSNLTIANGSTMELTSTVSNLPSAKRVGSGFHLSRLKSLVHKNWIQLIRHPGGLFFSLLFPIIDLLAFYVAVGGDLHDIKVAVVNNESNWTDCQNYLAHYSTASYDPANDTCQMNLLSCRFLNSFNDSFLTKEFYPDLESAVGAVRQGTVVGAMYFNHNYTEALSSRTNDARSVSDIDIDNSAINMWMDMSNRQIGWVIQYDLVDRYINFAKGVIKDCNQNLKQAELPVRIYEPVYGTKNEKYSVFMTPGMMLTINFFLATLLTSTVLVTDRLEGIWDRTVVAGCTTLEILLSHSITQITISIMQAIEIVIIVFIVVGVNCIGNYFTVILLLILQGIAGITYGFLISVYSDTSTTSLYLSTGSFYPMLFLSGVMWPIEGMPYALEQFAKILPFTIPITSLRNVLTRGWTITNIAVLNGFLITVAWVILFCIISFFKLSKNT